MKKYYLIMITMLLIAHAGFSQGNNNVQNYRKFDSLSLLELFLCKAVDCGWSMSIVAGLLNETKICKL